MNIDSCVSISAPNLKKESLRTPLPRYCCFSVTMRCSMLCKTCYIWGQKVNFSGELLGREWVEAVKCLPDFLDRGTDIIITGGEPLLKEDILDLIVFCSRLGYKISLQTNAALIDKELAKSLAEAGLWRVGISLYSLRDEIHDFLRGSKGVYKKVINAIDCLSKFAPGIGINIQTIVMDINLDDIIQMAQWVEDDSRLDYILYLAPMLPFGAEKDEMWFERKSYKFMWPQDARRVKTILDELIYRKSHYQKIANTVPQLQVFKKYFDHSLASGETKCNLGSRGINIDPEGNVFLCFSQPAIGNIRGSNLMDIWLSEKAQKARLQMKHCNNKCHFLINCSFNEKDLVL